MSSLEKLQRDVKDLYGSRNERRAAEWVDYLYPHHVLAVERFAKELAGRLGARTDLAQAAALLHDVADAVLPREDPGHAEESLRLARELMREAGFEPAGIDEVVDDGIRLHSCHGDDRPKFLEGKILATADSLAHLKTDFYLFAAWRKGQSGESLETIKKWTLVKLERDYRVKIFFDDVREEARGDYESLKTLFSR